MMKLSGSLYLIVLISFIWAVQTQVPGGDCSGGVFQDPRTPTFTSLAVFPNPAQVGQTVHIHTTVNIIGINLGDIQGGSLVLELKSKGQSPPVDTTISGIPLCGSSSSIVCSALGPGDNVLSFDYKLPEIPADTYTLKITVQPDNSTSLLTGCLYFELEVQDPDADADKYVSWINAELAGVAQFEHEDYLQRTLGEFVQIGPVGDHAPNILAYTFPWGTFINVDGSGDMIPPGINTAGYVWSLTGEMTQITYKGTYREHVYNGEFRIGWVRSLASRTMDVEMITGQFYNLTWRIDTDADGLVVSSLVGVVHFDTLATLPLGFSNPVPFGRLGSMSLASNSIGHIMAAGAITTCLGGNTKCNEGATRDDSSDDFKNWMIGLIIGVVGGMVLIFLIVWAALNWHRRAKRHEEEDGIFSATRKPEYGNALVVDDIIQETREHSPQMMPALSRNRQQDFSDSESDYSRGRSRSVSRSRSRSPPRYDRDRSRSESYSRSRSRSRSADSQSYSDSEYTDDAGSSASRD